MTIQPAKKKRPLWLIIIGGVVAICCFCVATSFAMDAMGLLPTSTPSPISNATSAPDPTQTIEGPTQLIIGKTLDDYLQEFGGNRDVYINILTITDCAALQEEFNIASANNARETPGTENFKWTLGYMTAADDQMKYLDCYTSPPPLSSPTIMLATLTVPATSTSMPTETATLIVIIPTQPPAGGGGGYDSNGDGKVTCKDFTTQAAAQQAYSAGYTNLDGNDNDGKACESLP